MQNVLRTFFINLRNQRQTLLYFVLLSWQQQLVYVVFPAPLARQPYLPCAIVAAMVVTTTEFCKQFLRVPQFLLVYQKLLQKTLQIKNPQIQTKKTGGMRPVFFDLNFTGKKHIW